MEAATFSEEEAFERVNVGDSGDRIRILRELEADRRLARLGRMLSEFDAFAYLGVSRSEGTHSKILAWLLNPREKHSMGDFFLKEFLIETKIAAEETRDQDWSETRVRREWRNEFDGEIGFLDILVFNSSARFVCGIENKVFSGEHSDQLRRYRQALCREFREFTRSHIFVTRDGTVPIRAEERKWWTSVGYGTILQLVEKAIERGKVRGNDETSAFLEQYATTLRRRIVPDSELRRTANRLYLQHREAINLIVDEKESHIAELKQICRQALEGHGNWTIVGERAKGELLGFTEFDWRRFDVFNTGTALPKGHPPDLLLLDFDFRKFGVVRLLLTIMTGANEDVRESLYEMTQGRHPAIFDYRGDERGGLYRALTIRLYSSGPILSESDFMDGDRSHWSKKVNTWLSDFAVSEFPEMNRIILESLQRIDREPGSRPA